MTGIRRIRTAIEWISAGKPRNWKYMKDRKRSAVKIVAGQKSR